MIETKISLIVYKLLLNYYYTYLKFLDGCVIPDDLASNSDVFRMKARNLSHQMWWRECRMRIILALVVVVILIIIFGELELRIIPDQKTLNVWCLEEYDF